MPPAVDPIRDILTVERIVAAELPREFRLSPRERVVAYTAEVAGARQVMLLPLRGGSPTQLTGGEKDASDPQWSPDGRRLVFVRDRALWVVEADGSREVRLAAHPAGESAPRWSPDGLRIAFISKRRGWPQVWIIDAPVPRRGRPARTPKAAEPRPVTATGIDIELFAWSPDGVRLAVVAQPAAPSSRHEISIVDVASGERRLLDGSGAWETGVRWLSGGDLLFVSDADGWFQVVRAAPDGSGRMSLTGGPCEHGEPGGAFGYVPLPSPDGRLFTHIEVHDDLCDLLVAPLSPEAPVKRRRGRPPKVPRPPAPARGAKLNPWDGVWRALDWLPDGAWVLAFGESEARPQDLWLLPVPGAAPDGSRPRRITDSLPAVLVPAFAPGRAIPAERVSFQARDGLRVEGTLWRPTAATGRRGGSKVPAVVYPHGGPTAQAFRGWSPFKQLLVREGAAFMDIDFRGSTGYGRAFREANIGEWGHADVFDLIDGARWILDQPWSDGRLAIYGGSYGGYMVLCALVEEPSLWRAGVDLFGDSEIAESYRHGDRVGRRDLHGMMGDPDDPKRAELYRRGSPLYRAERIEAPLLIFHGRRDRRVVPLMTERIVEALEIEGKHYQVTWYDEEGHGWEKRENRRDSYTKTRDFLRRHLLEVQPTE